MGVGEKGLTKNWSIGFLERQHPLLELPRGLLACAGGLLMVNSMGAYLRDSINSGLTLSMMAIDDMNGCRRWKWEKVEEPVREHQL